MESSMGDEDRSLRREEIVIEYWLFQMGLYYWNGGSIAQYQISMLITGIARRSILGSDCMTLILMLLLLSEFSDYYLTYKDEEWLL